MLSRISTKSVHYIDGNKSEKWMGCIGDRVKFITEDKNCVVGE